MASCTFSGVIAPFGNPTTEINRYSGVLDAWFQKGHALHANFDAQFGGADNWIYRIDPTSFFNITGTFSTRSISFHFRCANLGSQS